MGDLLVGRGSERFSSSFAVHSSLPAGKKKDQAQIRSKRGRASVDARSNVYFFDPFGAVNVFERRYDSGV